MSSTSYRIVKRAVHADDTYLDHIWFVVVYRPATGTQVSYPTSSHERALVTVQRMREGCLGYLPHPFLMGCTDHAWISRQDTLYGEQWFRRAR